MKQIIFILGGLTRGGGERVVTNLSNYYVSIGVDVQIITLLNDRVDYDIDTKVKVISLSKKYPRLLQLPHWIKSLRRIVKECQNVTVVSFFSEINIIVIASLLGLEKRLIVSERNDPKNDGRSFITKILCQFFYMLPEVIIFQTTWAKKQFNKHIREKSVILPNPVNVKKIAHINRKVNLNKIIAIGRLEQQKDFQFLIRAFSKMYDVNNCLVLHIYGEGNQRIILSKLIEDYGLVNNVILEGNIVNLHEEINDACLVLQTSKYEGLSNSLIECMSLGIPPVVTNYPGVDEVIEDGKNGVIVEKSELVFAKEVINLLSNESRRKYLSLNALESGKKYEMKNVIDLWDAVLIGRGAKVDE